MIKSSRLLIDEYPLLVLPKLAEQIGLNEAIVLQQVHYWLNRSNHFIDGKYWIYNTYKDWQKDNFPFWSIDTIKNIMYSLEDRDLIITDNFNKNKFNRTKWYTINYEKLIEIETILRKSNDGNKNEQFEASNKRRKSSDSASCNIYTIDDANLQRSKIENLHDSKDGAEALTDSNPSDVNGNRDYTENTQRSSPTADDNETAHYDKNSTIDLIDDNDDDDDDINTEKKQKGAIHSKTPPEIERSSVNDKITSDDKTDKSDVRASTEGQISEIVEYFQRLLAEYDYRALSSQNEAKQKKIAVRWIEKVGIWNTFKQRWKPSWRIKRKAIQIEQIVFLV